MEQLVNKLKELVKNNGSLIYAYIRGSHAYGLNVETSDIDTGGIYIANNKDLLSLPGYYKDQVVMKKMIMLYMKLENFQNYFYNQILICQKHYLFLRDVLFISIL